MRASWYRWYRAWRQQRRERREALAAQKAELERKARIQREADACADRLIRRYVAEYEHQQMIRDAVDEVMRGRR